MCLKCKGYLHTPRLCGCYSLHAVSEVIFKMRPEVEYINGYHVQRHTDGILIGIEKKNLNYERIAEFKGENREMNAMIFLKGVKR